MRFTRWVNPMLPQTLQYATMLFYISAVFGVLFGAAFSVIGLLITIGEVLSGLGIANSFKWGYVLAVVVSAIGAAFAVWFVIATGSILAVINALFPVALFALVVHPHSRQYQKIWFE